MRPAALCALFLLLLAAGPASAQTPLVNGGVASGSISVIGEEDEYTFDANTGDGLQLRLADVNGTSFSPRIVLLDPSDVQVTSATGTNVAAITIAAPATGTYTVVVSDSGNDDTGDYDLYFTRAPGANEGGVLPNGGVVSDTIDLGDLDSYTFAANAGEGLQLRVADVNGTGLSPRITLYDPTGAQVTFNTGTNVAALNLAAPSTGTYTVVVTDVSSGNDATGDYNLYLTRAPGANEGGVLPNGGVVSDTIDLGDLDSYTFDANAGEGLQLRVADVNATGLSPRITLYDPTGAQVTFNTGTNVAALNLAAPSTGTYTVVVTDVSSGNDATGDYNLYLTRAPGANEGGALPNGGLVADTIDLGDLDSYTFDANAGEGLQLRVADVNGTGLSPRITLYDPTGAQVTFNTGTNVAALNLAAPSTGTYTVVVTDVSGGSDATGPYNLYFTRAPGANEGGTLPNGGVVSDTIDLGDLDSYTFAANAGDGLQLRVADVNATGLSPRITLYDPTGAQETFNTGLNVAPLNLAAGSTGTYTVVVTDVSGGSDATGDYNLYFTRAPGANEGGTLPNGGVVSDTIDLGDLDSYTFTANAGEGLQLRVADLDQAGLSPRVTLYDPTGAQETFNLGTNVAPLNLAAPVTGTYTVVVTDVSGGNDGTGPYDLHYAKAPEAEELGLLKDGEPRADAISLGDVDSFVFLADVGQTAAITVTDTSGGALFPRITLYGPDGVELTLAQGLDDATIVQPINVRGSYTIMVTDVSGGRDATGSYEIVVTGISPIPALPWPAWALLAALALGALAWAGARGRKA